MPAVVVVMMMLLILFETSTFFWYRNILFLWIKGQITITHTDTRGRLYEQRVEVGETEEESELPTGSYS